MFFRLVVSLFHIVAFASPASAVTLHASGGQLLGAFDVNVNGSLYDVQFINGSCVGLFDGCDEPSDFAFDTTDDTNAANQALRDQVFIDGVMGNFDSQPELTNGCSEPFCDILTPFEIHQDGVFHSIFRNSSGTDEIFSFQSPPTDPNLDSTANGGETWAVWTVVPEPTTALLLVSGLCVLGAHLQLSSR